MADRDKKTLARCRDALTGGPDDPWVLVAMFAAAALGAACWALLLWALIGGLL